MIGSTITLLATVSPLTPTGITVFLLSLAALLGLARLLGEIARGLRQPAILGEILAGVVLGPTVLGAILPGGFEWLFPHEGSTRVALDGFITLSATLLLFVVGLDVDLSTVWRQGKEAVSVSAAGIVLPFAIGFSLAWSMPATFGIGDPNLHLPFALFFGIALSITALPVIAKILMDLNLAKSDMGMLVIASAMLNDLVGWIGFAVVLALLPKTGMTATAASPGVLGTISLTIVFLILMLTLGRYFAHRALPYVQARWSWPGGVIAFVFVFALLCAAFTEFLGIHSIFGAFIAGVAIGDSYHLTPRTRDTIHQFVTNIFSPIFFASIGLRIDFVGAFSITLVLMVFAVAATGKILGCFSGAKLAKMSTRESWAVGFGMAAQGAVGIILGQLALQTGLISNELLVAIVIMALGTSLLAGPLLQRTLQLKSQRRFIHFLADRGILIHTQPRNANHMIAELASRAAQLTALPAKDIERAVIQRERIMHTGLPHHLAVPHARLAKLNKPYALLATVPDGVDFQAADGEPAKIVCMILTPTDQPEAQIELLNLFATTFGSEQTRRHVLKAQTPTELLAVLNRATAAGGAPPAVQPEV